jgi:hypothetical protein
MARFTGERRALAAAVLALYGLLFLVVSLSAPPGWETCFVALAGLYGVGFFAVVAGYFWARWYAIGLGISGLVSAVISMWQIGAEPPLVFYGGTHAAISLLLWGTGMAGGYDGRKEWRTRFHLDDSATNRLGKAVIRVSVSLPYVVMYALAPREDAGQTLLAVGGLALAALGAWALVTMRTWGVVALGAGAAVLAATLAVTPWVVPLADGIGLAALLTGTAAVGLLVAGVAPFAGPMLRYLRRA